MNKYFIQWQRYFFILFNNKDIFNIKINDKDLNILFNDKSNF